MLNINVNTKKLLKALRIVENAIDEDNTDTNSGIYIESKDNMLELKGIGYNTFVKCECEADIVEEGKITIKYKLIEDFLRKVDEENINIIENESSISIISNTVNSKFNKIKYEKPSEITIMNGVEYVIDKKTILENLEKSLFSAASDPAKGVFNCIKFDIYGKILKIVSTDSFRLIYKEVEIIDNLTNENTSLNIPLKVIQGLLKIIREADSNSLILKSDGSKVLFKLDDIEVLTKVVETPFPDYQGILEKIRTENVIKIKKNDFHKKLELVQLFVRDKKEKKDAGKFEFKNNELTISGENELAKVEQKLIIVTEKDLDVKLYLNIRFIIEYLATINKDAVLTIDFSSPRQPIIIKENTNDNNIYLMMPVQNEA